MRKQYEAALHRIQSAIAFRFSQLGIRDSAVLRQLKYNRVGIDSMKAEQGGLVTLLIEKKLITREEYQACILTAIEREVEIQNARLPAGVST